MDTRLDGKLALVTGASRGIGRGVAAALASAGCDLVITSSDEGRIRSAAEELAASTGKRVASARMDLTRLEDVVAVTDRVAREHGPVDVLVANGPGPAATTALETSLEQFEAALRTSTLSVVALCQRLVPTMAERGFGRVLAIASTTAKEPDEGMVLSNVARAGVAAYLKTLSREVASRGVTVNTVLVGSVMSERSESLLRGEAEEMGRPYEEYLAEVAASIPAGRIASPGEFAAAVALLASPAASYLTGATVPVDGGWMRGW